MQLNQQRVVPCVKGVEWVVGTKGLRMVAAFWVGIPLEVTKEAGVVPHRKRTAIRTPFYYPHRTRWEKRRAYSTYNPQGFGGGLRGSHMDITGYGLTIWLLYGENMVIPCGKILRIQFMNITR